MSEYAFEIVSGHVKLEAEPEFLDNLSLEEAKQISIEKWEFI